MKSSRPGPGPKPAFLWQAFLILLPVVLLTVAGLWALHQDRRLVEQDARDRATEILSSLARQVERQLPSHLWEAMLQHASSNPLISEGRAPSFELLASPPLSALLA
jgi:sensor domain CHASE-containing protein